MALLTAGGLDGTTFKGPFQPDSKVAQPKDRLSRYNENDKTEKPKKKESKSAENNYYEERRGRKMEQIWKIVYYVAKKKDRIT